MTPAAEAPQGRRFSIAQLALLIPWVALVIGAWGPITDNSFLWHVRAGTVQLDDVEVLTMDPFSFTRGGEPWLTQSWLVELFYGWADRVTGLGFVPYSILLVGTLTFVGIGLIAYRYSNSPTASAFVLILGVLTLISFFVPRPVIYSYLLMVLVMVAWNRPGVRWSIPFLFWIWASVHASFFIGLAYIGLLIVMNREWREIPKAIAAGCATLLTAHGLGAVEFLVEFTESRDALQYLTEWRRPTVTDVLFIPFLGTIVFIVIGFLRRVVPLRFLWLFVPFAAMGFTSIRAVPQAWLGLAPVLALSLAELSIGSRAGLRQRLAVVFTVFLIILPFMLARPASLSDDQFPLSAISALEDRRTFHDDRVGGYLIYALGPERKVYVDDRAELYGDRLREFYELRTGQIDWMPIFERDRIEQAVLANSEVLVVELQTHGWKNVYSDSNFTVLQP